MLQLSNFRKTLNNGQYASLELNQKKQFWQWYLHAHRRNLFEAYTAVGLPEQEFYLTKDFYQEMLKFEPHIDSFIMEILISYQEDQTIKTKKFIKKSLTNIDRLNLLKSHNQT